jgi:hypothetical protein
MRKHKLKTLERKLTPRTSLDAPIFIFCEPEGYVVSRSLIEGLGHSTKEFKDPVEGSGVYNAGDSSLCLLPTDHELVIRDENYIQLKGALGLSIVI